VVFESLDFIDENKPPLPQHRDGCHLAANGFEIMFGDRKARIVQHPLLLGKIIAEHEFHRLGLAEIFGAVEIIDRPVPVGTDFF